MKHEDGDSSDDTAISDPAPTSPTAPRGPLIALVVSLVLLVAAVVIAVVTGIGYWHARDDHNDADARESALADARQAAINMHSVDTADIDGSLKRLESSVTGDLEAQVTQNKDQLLAAANAAKDAKKSNSATVSDAALTAFDNEHGTASAVVFLLQKSTIDGKDQGTTRVISKLTLNRIDGVWKVAAIEEALPPGGQVSTDGGVVTSSAPAPATTPAPAPEPGK